MHGQEHLDPSIHPSYCILGVTSQVVATNGGSPINGASPGGAASVANSDTPSPGGAPVGVSTANAAAMAAAAAAASEPLTAAAVFAATTGLHPAAFQPAASTY